MKRRTLLGALTLAASTAQAQAQAQAQTSAVALKPGQTVPWPDMALLGGGRFGAAQAADNAVVVVFWTTTCPFCRRHNQHVEKLHRAAAGKRLRVLGVARETDAELVAQYAKAQGYSFPITMSQPGLVELLSPREAECLRLSAHGNTDGDIGRKLGISARTARFHIENAKKKLGVATRVQAVAEALRRKAIAA